MPESDPYPIQLKEHGVDFLLDRRHLWIRTPRQASILRIRAEAIRAARNFMDDQGYTLTDAPIFTPAACEGTTTLFEVNYIDDQKAYLTQSGQLYVEATAAALGKVYTFGPTFRAEKSKTRRHLTEFWMLEPEAAYAHLEDMIELGEGLVSAMVQSVVKNRARELATLERDTAKLEKIAPPFPRISYDEAIEVLQKAGNPAKWGDDFGGDEETILSKEFDKPVIIHRYPAAMKAFYMATDPARPELALSFDMIAPEGYGEIIGGGERQSSYDTLVRRIREQQSAGGIVPVVSRPAALRQRSARGLRPGPRTHGRMDLRNRAHPRSDPLPTHAVSRLSLVALRRSGARQQNSSTWPKKSASSACRWTSAPAAAASIWARRRCALRACSRASSSSAARWRTSATSPSGSRKSSTTARRTRSISTKSRRPARASRRSSARRSMRIMLPLVLGGDHSIAVGTAAGVAAHFHKDSKRIGLIWLDAHGDMNTPDTSPSGNVHGMPLASIMGYGPPELTGLAPAKADGRAAQRGARRHSRSRCEGTTPHEGIGRARFHDARYRRARHARSDVRSAALRDRRHRGHRRQPRYGFRRSVGRAGRRHAVRGGVTYREAHLALEMIADSKAMVSFELVEINPVIDLHNTTATLGVELVLSGLGKKIL